MTLSAASKTVSSGTLKELVRLFVPVLIMAFSSAAFVFLQKIFFARISPETMESAINVTYVSRIFQIPCVMLAMMAQVYVGRAYGAGDFKSIGPIIWQFIWFSLLSMVVTVPGSLICGYYYFKDTAIEMYAQPYFHALVAMNFIFPLSAALSCFFIGRGYTKWVMFCKLVSEFFTLILAYFLILGNKWGPPLGLKGGAISLFIGNAGFCVLLLIYFLHQKNSAIYHSRQWRFNPSLFWSSINPGLLRGLNGILNFASWSAIARMMTAKGGDFRLVLSMGGAVFLFLSCFGEALCQAITTVFSQMIGAKKTSLITKAIRSGFVLSMILSVLIGIPFILFPIQFSELVFPTIAFSELPRLFYGLWVSISLFIMGFIPVGLVLSLKDTKFSLFMGAFSWVNGYGLMYLVLQIIGINAADFWLALSLMHFTTLLLYSLRARKHISDLKLESLIEIKS